eukprot:720870-Pyramimonas_sp.AAC.1
MPPRSVSRQRDAAPLRRRPQDVAPREGTNERFGSLRRTIFFLYRCAGSFGPDAELKINVVINIGIMISIIISIIINFSSS